MLKIRGGINMGKRGKSGGGGRAIIKQAIAEAKEELRSYQQEQAMLDEADDMLGGKGGKGFGGEMDLFGAVGEAFGGLALGIFAFAVGFIGAAIDSANGFGRGFNVPDNLNDDEVEVYQQALLDAFGYTGFQVGDWTNWQSVEDYVSDGGFMDGDNGSNIRGLLQEGEYYKC